MQRRDNLEFLFRGNPGENDLSLHRAHQILIAHSFQFHAGDHAQVLAAHNANAPGNAFSGQAVIAGNHDDANARVAAFFHRLGDVHTGRVHHGYYSQEGQLSLDGFNLIIAQFAGEHARGGSQYAQTLAGVVIVLRHDVIDPVLTEGKTLFTDLNLRAGIQNFADAAFYISHTPDSAV